MTIDLDRPIQDELVLRTLPGAVDYLFEDLRQLSGAAVTVIRRFRNGLRISYDGPLRPLAGVRYFDVASIPFGGTGSSGSGGSGGPDGGSGGDDGDGDGGGGEFGALTRSENAGVLSAFADPGGPRRRFRVADIGDRRWPLAERMTTVLGWENSAGDWDVNVACLDERGQLVAEIGPLHLTRRFGPLERMPASTNPLVAAVMVRLAKLETGDAVLDPFCGAGTLLTIAGETTPGVHLIGRDQNPGWLDLTGRNLGSRGLAGDLAVGDAQHLALDDASIDRVVSNFPFGKRIGSHAGNTELYPGALREIARVMHNRSRAVLLTDDKRLFKESVQRTPLIRVVKEIMLEQHGGLHPTAYVISKRGNSRRPPELR